MGNKCRVLVPARYVFTIMGMIGLTTAYMMRACLGIAMTRMVPNVPQNSSHDSLIHEEGKFNWSEETQGIILSSFYWGYIVTHIPGGMLSEKFGGKYVLGIGVLLTAALTLLTPLAVAENPLYLIIVRFLEGVGEGVTFPATYTLIARWAPPTEKGFIAAFVSLGIQVGTFLGNFLGGVILQYIPNGWNVIFYSFGTVSIIWFFFWCFLCYNDPESHPYISKEEKIYIQETIGSTCRKKNQAPTPWKSILTSRYIWVLIIAGIGHDWGIYTIITDLPKYMNDVQQINSIQNGIMSGVPFLAIVLVSCFASILSDWLLKHNVLPITVLRKTYVVISSVGPSAGIICAAYVQSKIAVSLCLIVGMGCIALAFSSLRINALDLSPNYSGSIIALVNGIGCVSGMLTPYIVGLLTTHRSAAEWRLIFWIMGVILTSTNLLFVAFGSVHLQPWNEPDSEEIECEKKHVSNS